MTAIRAGIEKTQVNALPMFDIDDARRLYDVTLGGVAGKLRGASSLVIAPTGPLLSLPFEVLLTGPADPAKLAAAPWLVRQATITHVPAATNFVSLRKVANSSRGDKQWFGFGDFHPVSLAQAQRSFPVGPCGENGRLLAALAGFAGRGEGIGDGPRRAERRPSDDLAGRRVHRRSGAEHAAEELQGAAFRGARAAADRSALPDRGGDRDLAAAGRGGREGRPADRVATARPGSRRQSGDPVGVQFGRPRRRRRRKPVRPRAVVLLRHAPARCW